MVSPIDRSKILWPVDRAQGEREVLAKIDEMISEINRMEQILDFLSQVVNSHEGNNDLTDDTDVQ